MTVGELIEKLGQFPKDMEVVYDYDYNYSTIYIDQVYIGREYHDEGREKVVVIE